MAHIDPSRESSSESWESASPDEFVFDSGRLSKQRLVELSAVSPVMSSLHIAVEWLLIALAIAFCQHYWNLLLYLVTIAFIGARQHALLILMHDGAHYRLFRNRRINDWVSEILLAWPNFVTMQSYRQNHFAHHRYLNIGRDPDWTRKKDDAKWHFPKSWAELWQLFAADLFGSGAVYNIQLSRSLSARDSISPRILTLGRPIFYLLVFVVMLYCAALKGFALYWIVPFVTWLMLVLRLRSIAEHFAIVPSAGTCSNTRTTLPGILDKVFVAPKNIGFHLEHHLYPNIHFFRLPELHKLLMSDAQFASSAHLTKGYAGVVYECHGVGH
jgi:fatty acid desaturase